MELQPQPHDSTEPEHPQDHPPVVNPAEGEKSVFLNLDDEQSPTKISMGLRTLVQILILTLSVGGTFWYVNAGVEKLKADNVQIQHRLDQMDSLNLEVIRLGTKIDFLTEEIRFLRQRVPVVPDSSSTARR